jgi:hypothetical protein
MLMLLLVVGMGFAAWEIVFGLQSRQMSALGSVFTTAARDRQPVRYWLFFGLNALFLIGTGILVIHQVRP